MSVRSLFELTLLSMMLAACVTAGAQSRASAGLYRYDPALGKCQNVGGQAGLNLPDPATLFAQHDAVTNTYTGADAECVDFTDFDFGAHVGLAYPVLDQWNFRGAKLERAKISFANVSNADFAGTDLRALKYGYATIQGQGDSFTQGDSCPPGEDFAIQCTK